MLCVPFHIFYCVRVFATVFLRIVKRNIIMVCVSCDDYNLQHVSIVKFSLWRLFIMTYIQFAICFNGKIQFMAFVYLCIYVQFAVCINCEMQYMPFPCCDLRTILPPVKFLG